MTKIKLETLIIIIVIFIISVLLLVNCQPNPFLSDEGSDIWKSTLWKEKNRLDCITGDLFNPIDRIIVRFLYNGEFVAYYGGEEDTNQDLSGTYYYDMDTYSFRIEINYHGGDYPESTFIDKMGSFEIIDKNNILLKDIFFGGEDSGCGHLLEMKTTEYN